ncbi:MAG: hypothetical protein L0229_10500 [Blastocatellia bacterium]|nr:hypothetical protein [Blastocatellia bacterium]
MVCHSCGGEIKLEGYISRSDECPHCSTDIHCCLNCEHYDPAAHNRCREPQAEWVSEREKANFCDYFMPNTLQAAGRKTSSADDVRKAFDSLFKT